MKNFFKAIGTTILIVLVIILVAVTVYISMWVVLGMTVLLLGYSIYTLLQAKDSLK